VEPKRLPQRSTRGNRMESLIAKGKEDDDFYKNVFGEDEEDESFNSGAVSASQGKDSFDSDFDVSDGGEGENKSKRKQALGED
jgi:hypothetical protein